MCSLIMNIARILESNAKRYSNRPAIIFKDQLISFRELKELSFRFANSIISLGVKKGDKIAIYLPDCPEYVYSYLAIWSIGATAVPLDFMLTEDELSNCLSHSESKLLIAKPKASVALFNLKENCTALEQIIVCYGEDEKFLSFAELLNKGKDEIPKLEIQGKDYANIFYTSGSTGKPKGVLCNYRQLEAPAKSMAYFVDLSDKDIALCGALPFSHLGGLVFIQAIIFLGTTVVIMERFIPFEFLKNIQNYKVTCFWLVPSMYYAILQLKEFETFDLSNLHWICVFGAPSSMDQISRFHKYCPQAKLIHGWGMTETQGPAVTNFRSLHKKESIGSPVPWIELKIFDENDQELAGGQIGEIVVRSWVVARGYYKDPELNQQAMRHGWFHTGDLGKIDRDGDLYIVGRKKEMLKVAGEIVFEPEVETVLQKHPQVVEAAVIGVPDKLRGEVPKAFIVLKDAAFLGEDDLRSFCRQHLAHFKVPHYFEFKPALPKNRAGKIDKEQLRKTGTSA